MPEPPAWADVLGDVQGEYLDFVRGAIERLHNRGYSRKWMVVVVGNDIWEDVLEGEYMAAVGTVDDYRVDGVKIIREGPDGMCMVAAPVNMEIHPEQADPNAMALEGVGLDDLSYGTETMWVFDPDRIEPVSEVEVMARHG